MMRATFAIILFAATPSITCGLKSIQARNSTKDNHTTNNLANEALVNEKGNSTNEALIKKKRVARRHRRVKKRKKEQAVNTSIESRNETFVQKEVTVNKTSNSKNETPEHEGVAINTTGNLTKGTLINKEGPANTTNDSTNETSLNKKGAGCPKPNGMGICVQECNNNSECAAPKLCCSNGCGHVCMIPEVESPVLKKCTLLVVLPEMRADNSSSVDQVMEKIPVPTSKQPLYGVKILIIDYSTNQLNACCEADKKLRSMPMVKSVEFDGTPPDCDN